MKIKTFITLFLVLLILTFSGYTLSTAIASYTESYKSFRSLESNVRYLARHFPGQCSYVIKDFQKPYLEFSYAQNIPFPAASLIKLPIAAVAYKAVKEKKFDLSQPITINQSDITTGSGELKTLSLPVTLTYKELVGKMLSFSDNTATNKLIELLGYEYINKGFRELGLKRTSLRRKMMDFSQRKRGVENYTTASDTVFLLERIYAGQLIDQNASGDLLEFLKEQKMRDRIPKYLPRSVVVAHKTGLEKGVVHDAGIIFSSKGNRLICVLTKKIKNKSSAQWTSSGAKRFIAHLSLLTYTNLYKE